MQPWMYTHLYKKGAPWERHGVGDELTGLVDQGRLDPKTHPRLLDFGCGSGITSVYLAQQGFDVLGVDFTPIALDRARERSAAAGVADHCRFAQGDLSESRIDGVDDAGPFDLLVDYSTIDDAPGPQRRAMAGTVHRLTRPGSLFFLWCFSAHKRDLPMVARGRISRLLHTVMAPGEERDLFASAFAIEPVPVGPRPPHAACFLMTRR
jgi:SAM-dependent methyltransferase